MSNGWLIIVLRVLHIGAGIFWVGSVLFLNLFVGPAVQRAGPDGGRFMGMLMQGGRLTRALTHAATWTIVSGLLIYGLFSMRTEGVWARSAPAMGYGLGAIAALIAFGIGLFVNAPASRRMQQLGAGGAPDAAQQAELERLRARLTSASRLTLWLLLAAVLSMAISRYL